MRRSESISTLIICIRFLVFARAKRGEVEKQHNNVCAGKRTAETLGANKNLHIAGGYLYMHIHYDVELYFEFFNQSEATARC